jgi:hypothetical protein
LVALQPPCELGLDGVREQFIVVDQQPLLAVFFPPGDGPGSNQFCDGFIVQIFKLVAVFSEKCNFTTFFSS